MDINAQVWDLGSQQAVAWFERSHAPVLAELLGSAPGSDAIWFERGPKPDELAMVLAYRRACGDLMIAGRCAALADVEAGIRSARFADTRDGLRGVAGRLWRTVLAGSRGFGLPADYPMFADQEAVERRVLFVRVGRECPAALSIPFDFYVAYPSGEYAAMGRYRDVEWITSCRTWGEAGRNRALVQCAYSDDPELFLSRCRFIINGAYEHWDEVQREHAARGVGLLRRLQGVFPESHRDVFLFDPDPCTVRRVLECPDCRYLFCNFHTRDAMWVTCDEGTIDVASLADGGAFANLDLISASHCNSVSRPGGNGGESICEALIRGGAKSVSGSPDLEYVTDFLCRVLGMLCETFGAITFQYAVVTSVDFDDVLDSVDKYLGDNGYPPVRRPFHG